MYAILYVLITAIMMVYIKFKIRNDFHNGWFPTLAYTITTQVILFFAINLLYYLYMLLPL